MQSVDLLGLDKLDREFKHILQELPEAKRALHEEIGAIVSSLSRHKISKLNVPEYTNHITLFAPRAVCKFI